VSCSQSAQTKVDLAYIQPDHLDTPRTVTDSTQKVIWQWDNQDPFGANAANEDPDGDGKRFSLNLRFPGQYFDSETGLHYNYFRDYDPSTGRYVESDPLGLEQGVNTYAYVAGNPVRKADPLGLFEAKPGDNSVYPPSTNCSCTLACMADPNRGGWQICRLIPSKKIVIKGVPLTINPARWLCETVTKAWACEDLCADFCRGASPKNPMSTCPAK